MKYQEQLKSPLWQKKRLEILERDSFTCQLCSDTETELHIHHKSYEKGKKAWEYENDNFQTLCKHCHIITETYKNCDITPIVSGKSYNLKCEYNLLSSILNHDREGLVLSLDRFYDDGRVEHLMMIDRVPFGEINELFNHAEKLIK